MRRLKTFIMSLTLIVCVIAGTAVQARTAASASVQDPKAFIQNLGDKVIKILERKDLTKDMLRREFNGLLAQSFDMPTIGRFVLGPYWRQATPAQQQEYMKLFQAMIVDLYANRFINYSGQKFQILGSRAEGDRDVLVDSRIIQASGGQPVDVSWRVRNANGSMKIVDVVVEGVSMGATQRADFNSVIQQRGGVDGLLTALRERIARLNSGAS